MKSLKKKYTINATAQQVYEALVKPSLIEVWSGDEAVMTNQPNTEFSLWGGSIHGKNIEVSPSKIVQDWQESTWDKPSKVTFSIKQNDGSTELELIHEDIPEASYDDINDGWDDYYLGPLKELLEQ